MRLLAVTVRNYRIHRERTVTFDRSRTLIGGPNEAGKSTLVEAVHRVLFLRSRTTGAVLEGMRSRIHAGHPSIELVFESGGTTYTLTKQFTGTNTAPTTLVEAGGRTLRDEKAEEKLQEILGTETVSGQGAERRLRMQWSHLWVWQGEAGDDPFDGDTLAKPLGSLEGRLRGLREGDVLESPLDAVVRTTVETIQAARTRNNGAAKADSPLALAEAALSAARDKAAAARGAVDALEEDVEAAEKAAATILQSERSLAERKRELRENAARLDEVQKLEVLHAGQKARVTVAESRLKPLEEADRAIRDCDASIDRIERLRIVAAEDRDGAERHLDAAIRQRASAEAGADRLRQEQANVAALADLHRRAEHLARRCVERDGLAERCTRIIDFRTAASDLETQLATLPRITAADVADLADLERARELSRGLLDATATRLELLEGQGPVRLGLRELRVGEAETISTETELVADGLRVRLVPGGGTSLLDATRSLDEATRGIEARLRAIGVADVRGARRVQARRQSLESSLEAKRAAVEGLGGHRALADLQALNREIHDLTRSLRGERHTGFVAPEGLDAAVAARVAVEERLHAVGLSASSAEAALKAAREGAEDARGKSECANSALRKIEQDLRDVRMNRDFHLREHGTDRGAALDAARREHVEAQAEVDRTTESLGRLQPDLLRQRSGMLQRAIEKLEKSRHSAETVRATAMQRLRSEGTLDPRADLVSARAAERRAEAARDQAAREARAFALLARLFVEKKREVEERFVAPLVAKVGDYLRCVFGPDADVHVEYADGRFRLLSLSRPQFGQVPFEFGALSGGGREQVGAALRLAMAEILAAGGDGCLPVVFDDAFVNSDPGRLAGVLSMLDLAAERGLQVILLSCNDRDYDSLGATTLQLAPPRPSGPEDSAR